MPLENVMEDIQNIQKEILEYYEMIFENEEDDYNYNKTIKNKLKDIMINAKNNNIVIEKALSVLAESTGCAEDQEIAEEIVNYLFENKFINDIQLDLFYNNIGTGRWS
jgi:hypothetical protein